MGIIRLLLALSVLALHCKGIFGLTLVNGDVAVQAFYIISGFYMAMVLSEKYNKRGWGNYKVFITNRLMKILPIYWSILLSFILLGLAAYFLIDSDYVFEYYIENYAVLTPLNWLLTILTNILVVGQDLLFLIGYNPLNQTYFLQTNYGEASLSLHRFLFLKQAWTLSLELYFYLLAPFINRIKTSILVIFFVLSLMLRLYVYSIGFTYRPWSYQFFPFEIAFFLLGVFSYRFYARYFSDFSMLLSRWVFFLLLLLTLSFQFFPFNDSYLLHYSYLIIVAASLPMLFFLTKNSKLDKLIGDLSYPVYISHTLIMLLFIKFITPELFGIAVAVVSIIVSIFLNRLIGEPIDKWRQKRAQANISTV